MNVALIDYRAGNLPSVERALRRAGAVVTRASSPDALQGAEAIVLPGVGHFAALARGLDERGLREPLRRAIELGAPFLGICLGLHALYERSEEAPNELGLGMFAGAIAPLPPGVKLPHMGWNRVQFPQRSRLFDAISSDSFFYFAHSFAAIAIDDSTSAVCDYGVPFVAALEKGNLFAVQFHPEKSGEVGAQILRNFLANAS